MGSSVSHAMLFALTTVPVATEVADRGSRTSTPVLNVRRLAAEEHCRFAPRIRIRNKLKELAKKLSMIAIEARAEFDEARRLPLPQQTTGVLPQVPRTSVNDVSVHCRFCIWR
jgi:hypothetical protein